MFSQPGQRLLNGHPINSRRSLVGLDTLVGPVQVFPAQNPFKQIRTILLLYVLTANTLRSRIPFVFRTCSLRAAQVALIFCVLHVDLLRSAAKSIDNLSKERARLLQLKQPSESICTENVDIQHVEDASSERFWLDERI